MTENLTNIAQLTLISLTHKGVGVDTTQKKAENGNSIIVYIGLV